MYYVYSVTLYTYVHVCTCSTLQSIYKEIQSEKDRLVEELADLKRSATPRPEWSRCGIYIEGGPERWSELSEGRDSERMLDILLAQMTGKEESEVSKGQAFNGKVWMCIRETSL